MKLKTRICKDINIVVNNLDKNLFKRKKGHHTHNQRNFCYFITSPNHTENLSVTYVLDSDTDFVGLSPEINEEKIVAYFFNDQKEVKDNSPFLSRSSLDEFTNYLIQNQLWYLNEEKQELKQALCKRVLLAFSQHYFSYYVFDENDQLLKEALERVWEGSDISENLFDYTDIGSDLELLNCDVTDNFDLDSLNCDITDDFNLGSGVLKVRKINGRIPQKILDSDELKDVHYKIGEITSKKGDKTYVVCLARAHHENHETASNIGEFYDSSQNSQALYCVSPVFYSGTTAQLIHLDGETLVGKNSVFNIKLLVGRGTYATLLGLKDPRMNYNEIYFTPEEREALIKFDRHEQDLQRDLLEELSTINKDNENSDSFFEDSKNAINNYLDKSHNFHEIDVAGNIITKDGYLLFTRRGEKTFDTDMLYPSTNGVSEVYDERVTFYKKMAGNDTPKIKSSWGNFNGELTREASAELNIDLSQESWKYYGIGVFGCNIKENNNHSISPNFHVLGYNYSNYDLDEVRRLSTTAIEKEENENVLGNKIILTRKPKYFWEQFKSNFDSFRDFGSDFLLLLLTIPSSFYLISNMLNGNFSLESNFNWNSLLDYWNIFIALFALMIVGSKAINFISSYFKAYLSQKRYKKVSFCPNYLKNYDSKKISELEQTLSKKLLWKDSKAFIPFYLLTLLYYFQNLNEFKNSKNK